MNLTAGETSQLAATFGCKEVNLGSEIAKYSSAAEEEYLRMILGQRVFTRGQDILEYRLYLLIKNVFGGHLPSEQQISSLFRRPLRKAAGCCEPLCQNINTNYKTLSMARCAMCSAPPAMTRIRMGA